MAPKGYGDYRKITLEIKFHHRLLLKTEMTTGTESQEIGRGGNPMQSLRIQSDLPNHILSSCWGILNQPFFGKQFFTNILFRKEGNPKCQ